MNELVLKQKEFFRSEQTFSYAFRLSMLKKLKQGIVNHEKELYDALYIDLGKPEIESRLTEVWFSLQELNEAIRKLKKWMKPVPVPTPLVNLPGKSSRIPSPLGVTLIISPWNYPFNLTICPLVAAIAAGNTVLLKPSQHSKEVSKVIAKIIKENFPPEYIAVFEGGREQADQLLSENFDHVFFTGSAAVGRKILARTSSSLARVTLELGGKSPCIVDEGVNITKVAKRIAFGKLINSGQTCIAPDYLICHENIKDSLLKEINNQFHELYEGHFISNPQYGKIISRHHFERIETLLNQQKIIYGGQVNSENLKIAPTIVEGNLENISMKEEIFGPILPVLTFKNAEDIKNIISSNPNPLAFYLFSNNRKWVNQVISSNQFGGGCVNDTISHLIGSYLPFGGIKESGHGHYHGYHSFLTFSHLKSVYYKNTHFDLKIKYPPYSKFSSKLIKKFFK